MVDLSSLELVEEVLSFVRLLALEDLGDHVLDVVVFLPDLVLL